MLTNIRHTLPDQVQRTLLPDEEVYFYTFSGGCLSGPRQHLIVTSSRVTGKGVDDRGRESQCAIPLEHVSAVRVVSDGCLSSTKSLWITSSGGAVGNRFKVKGNVAEEAANLIQLALQQRR